MNIGIAKKSEEWRRQWRAKIGAGRAAAAAGIHEFLTPLELFISMTEGVDIDPETNPNLMRGLLLEPVALTRLQMLHTNLDFTPHDQEAFIYNDKFPFASDLPDFWVSFNGEKIPGQVKCPTPENWRRLDESVPDYIQAACVHSAAMNNAPAILLACLNSTTMEIHRNVYTPSQEAIAALMEAEQRFYDRHIVPRIPPAPQTHEDLRLRWPEAAAGTCVSATAEIEEDMHRLLAAKLTAKQATGIAEEIKLRVQIFMEDAEILKSEGGRVMATWKSHQHSFFNSTALKNTHPEVWKEFVEDRPVRTFLVKSKNLID